MSTDPIWSGRPTPTRPRYPLTVFLWPLLAMLAIVTVLVWMYRPESWSAYDPSAKSRLVVDRGPLDDEEQKTIQLYKNARPSVIHVTLLIGQRHCDTMTLEQIPGG